ncbi:MAG: GerMN domain-containing protein [bacterium]|nr:GerMN domain-containing protein [bacterium]
MNFAQKLGLFVLVLLSIALMYFSFNGNEFKMPDFGIRNIKNNPVDVTEENAQATQNQGQQESVHASKIVTIYLVDKSGKIRSVNRTCDIATQKSCYEYAIKELVKAPTKWEKSHGFTSEIPSGTKILSIREAKNNIMIDVSSDFESGGGAESTYIRIKQLIKTVNSNSKLPTYLYIDGKQANVIGGEGIMVKQPLNGASLDE